MTAATSATESAQGARWITAAALQALAAKKKRTGSAFTIRELRKWAPDLEQGRSAQYATRTMRQLGFITSIAPGQYLITAEGAAAIRAARNGKVLKSGAHGPKNRPPAPTTFCARLWSLVRVRKIVDSESAAETLVDAGGDVAKACGTAMMYLRLWEKSGYLQSGKHRLPNGRKRYVLVNDPGPVTPTRHAVRPSTTNAVNA